MSFIKDIFLRLTEYTIPHGYEEYLEPILKEFDLKKDSIGNYYKVIGESETLFTTHLDTYSKEFEKVNHIIDGNIIKTDEKTILGGDNKLGCSILLYMIKNNVPGTYYFFLGEEPIISGGLYGSRTALEKNPEFFKKFKRAIAFDRKQKGSIVTRQMARQCCSIEFVSDLSDKFNQQGMDYKADPKAYYTDTATFLDTISECTNISAGGWNEHFVTEFVDISYTEQLAEAAIRIDWESLPAIREVKNYDVNVQKMSRRMPKKLMENVMMIMDKYDHLHTNKLEWKNIGNHLEFNHWFEDTKIILKFDKVLMLSIDGSEFKNITSLKQLDVELSKHLGVLMDEDQNDVELRETTIVIDDIEFGYQEYINHFNSINTEKTSYKIEKGGDQFEDISGLPLYRDQFIQWLYSFFG